jgi:HAD superfamily hydrolase (TIGR01509 family)
LKLVRGVAEFLLQLDAVALPSAVATSGSRRRVEQALQAFNIRDCFRAVVTGNDVNRGKPDPALFLLAAQALQVDVSRILVCEDAVAGVVAAKRAGMKCIGIAANGRESILKQAGADLVMNDFTHANLDEVRQLFT